MAERRIPIDYHAIAEQTGLRRGKLGRSIFGWGVQNEHGDASASFVCVDPPEMRDDETSVRIEDGHWCFT